ncbi:DNA-binding response regulator [Rhodobacteraceae bacterium WD3A24]|nr:DNA-binding response regulator [Rhodobacteraceae bacterium WD3A24]
MRFLLVEDNQELAASIVTRMGLDGHVVDHAAALDAAETCLRCTEYDLILLDVMLPDGDGRDFLSRHRSDRTTPVIVLTARSQVSDRVGMLDLGADDYITKPFDFSELEARIRAVLRRRGGAADNRITLGDVTVDLLAGTLRVATRDVTLRNRELRLLEVFIRNPGQILSKAQLLDRLFSFDAEITENAIEVYVARLRRRLDGGSPRIETVRGMGYRMTVQ